MGDLWNALVETVRHDFRDFRAPHELVRTVLRLLMACGLGGILGYQREHSGHEAGLRTHMLVSIGAALLVVACDGASMKVGDISRVVQGIITGIGFLGAGAILKHTDRGRIRGLTTAAGIWLTATVGVAAGLGRLFTATLGTLLGLFILTALRELERAIQEKANHEEREHRASRRRSRTRHRGNRMSSSKQPDPNPDQTPAEPDTGLVDPRPLQPGPASNDPAGPPTPVEPIPAKPEQAPAPNPPSPPDEDPADAPGLVDPRPDEPGQRTP